MRIGVIGGGVVGRATARAWQEHCEEVLTYDAIPERRTSYFDEVMACNLIFVCVPEERVEELFSKYALQGRQGANLVLKSTVPVGTTRRLREKYGLTDLVHSPEFLTERCSIWDAQNPSHIIVGVPDPWDGDPPAYDAPEGIPSLKTQALDLAGSNQAAKLLIEMSDKRFPGVPMFVMSSGASELVKLMTNAFAATKVALFNEFYELVEKIGFPLCWPEIREALLADGRIGNAWTKVPGPDGKRGFGGKCLPKDVKMLLDVVREAGLAKGASSIIGSALQWARWNQ